MLKFLIEITSRKEKLYFILLCLYACLSSLLDLLSIGFALALFNNEVSYINSFKQNLEFQTFIILFGFIFFISGIIRAGSSYLNAQFAYYISKQTITRAMNMLPDKYVINLRLNNDEKKGYLDLFLVKFPILAKGLLYPYMQLVSALFIIVIYFLILMALADLEVFMSIAIIVAIYCSIFWATKKYGNLISRRLAFTQRELAAELTMITSSLKEFFYSKVARENFRNTINLASELRDIERDQSNLIQLPRFFVEGLSVVILCFILSFSNAEEALTAFVGIGLLAQKFMPMAQQVQRSVNNLQTNKDVINELSVYLSHQEKDLKMAPAQGYEGAIELVRSLNPGEWLLIRGKSGSGKTYFIDIIAGLRGDVRNQLGPIFEENSLSIYYLSQDPLFLQGSLKKTTGYNPTEHKDYLQMLKLSRLDGINNITQDEVSGGEKQRLALLRMLIQKPNFVLMDEATNALDSDLEQEVIQYIKKEMPHSRVIYISHNEAIFNFADRTWSI